MATLVPLREAADLLRVSRQHVSRLVAAGELHPRVAPCGCRLFETDELLARRRNPPPRGPRPHHGNPPGGPAPEPYNLDAEHVEEGPDPLDSEALIRVLTPCSVQQHGQALAAFQPGPCRTTERLARMLVDAGKAERLAR